MMGHVTITQDVVERAWLNWMEFHYGLDCEETMGRFFKMIDPTGERVHNVDPWNGNEEHLTVDAPVAAVLKIAAGPHYKVLFKAWYIKNPWK